MIDSTILPKHMSGTFPTKTFYDFDDRCLGDALLYRSNMFALQHVCVTQPDINFVVNKLSQYMQFPSICH